MSVHLGLHDCIILYMLRCYSLYCIVCPKLLKILFINLVLKKMTEVYKQGKFHWKVIFLPRQGWINVMKRGLRDLPLSPLPPTTDAVEYLHPNAPADTVKDEKGRSIISLTAGAQKSQLFKAWWAQSFFFLHRRTLIWWKAFFFS